MLKLKERLAVFVFLFIASSACVMATPLLPDLTVASRDVQVLGSGSSRALYFSTLTTNQGSGPVELRVFATRGGVEDVNQRIYNSDGTYTEQFAGTFVYHTGHGHIHFEDFANYYLREVTAGGGVGAVVAGMEKVSFCILDSQRTANPPTGSPSSPVYGGSGPGTYPACSNTVQGLSSGWLDVYSYTLAGQSISLNGISGGTYWLELVTDPTNRLAESDDTNNFSRVQVTFTTSFSPEIDLTGNGQSIPNNDSTPSTSDGTDFGSVDVDNDTLTRTFTIQNSGTGSLSLIGVPKVQIAGSSDFTVVTQPVSPLAASGGTTTFQIKFDPSSAGPRAATVIISNNDANEGSYQFAIQGNGVADTDGDKEDNISEAASGTNPNDPNSFVRSGKQLNISTRLDVQEGDNVGIGGFIITGVDQKTVLIRGLGPSLGGAGLPQILPDPFLELHDSTGAVIASNNDWQDTQQTEIANTGLAPGNLLEAAILKTLSPGSYTAIIKGNGNTNNTGVGLVEVYDVDLNSNSTLGNISTRGFAGTGDNVMIGGEIVGRGLGANGSGSANVLIRALGPSLAAFGISGALQDPVLELRDGNGALITSNDNWKDTQQSQIQATGLAPSDDRESAILAILTKGNYTAVLLGKNNTTGVALIEAYKVQ